MTLLTTASLPEAAFPAQELPPVATFDMAALLLQLEQYLLGMCASMLSEEEWWLRMADFIHAQEDALPQSEWTRYEARVDCLLVRYGLTAWSIAKRCQAMRAARADASF